ncbi:MAG: alpha/beta fold hydrolase [Blastocatellia bacterium]|nr:alpha/beta fold hydrolase [Blastocatellia bacterium]MCS7157998.1 alpha/beta fold hydrolase [Blastocatellia bacterium]MCX7752505.1 alpha/beta fold hydrolase [Blastocatellia bacterium]MDW8167380.1 alpha/beta fold hydrolase [Acidobacteriota bacterium]MDW8255831.1 alpha/beta fold hydrolase [Acidobacteriota bacterium]
MPTVTVNDLKIFYMEQGCGEAVVFLPGLGGDHFLWHRQVPAFAAHFRAIAMDNRGAGQSDQPDVPYSIEQMADDVAGLLDALGIERSHVVGASMGGFIAQMFALRHPHRLNRLILCGTSFGGPNVIPMPPESLAVFAYRTGDPETDLRRVWTVSVTEQFLREHPEVLEEYVAWRVAHPQSPHAYQRQLAAALAFDLEGRVHEIHAPTLIAHGAEDRVVPVENARRLHARIPHSRLVIVPEAGHLFFIERAEAFNRMAIAFLKGEEISP